VKSGFPGILRRRLTREDMLRALLLAITYWGSCLAIHVLESALRWRYWILVLTFVPPFLTALIALGLRVKRGVERLGGLGFPVLVLISIYILGPTYGIISEWILRIQSGKPMVGSFGEKLVSCLLLTLIAPVSTFILSVYDGTPAGPFLASLGVWATMKVRSVHPANIEKGTPARLDDICRLS